MTVQGASNTGAGKEDQVDDSESNVGVSANLLPQNIVFLDQVDAEDCTQQTWMALYSSRDRIKDADKLPNWLASTAYRRAMRIHRNRYTREKAAQNNPVSESPITPDEHLSLIERRKILAQALERLDEPIAYNIREGITALFTTDKLK